IEGKGLQFFPISAATGEGVKPLIYAVSQVLDTLPPIKLYEKEEIPQEELLAKAKQEFTITLEDGVYIVDADWLASSLGGVDMEDYESLQYFQRVLRSSGIIAKLDEMGIKDGDTVSILNFEFEYLR
ncbi:MAG: Obg family GTPase CgtA, partial [Hydrogenoanaerobacterium sp.]